METRSFSNIPNYANSIGRSVPEAPPESASGIRDAISHGEEIIAELHGAISHLESRLDTALTPTPSLPPSTGINGKTDPMPVASNVRSRIGQINYGMNEAVQRLNALRDRVEI